MQENLVHQISIRYCLITGHLLQWRPRIFFVDSSQLLREADRPAVLVTLLVGLSFALVVSLQMTLSDARGEAVVSTPHR